MTGCDPACRSQFNDIYDRVIQRTVLLEFANKIPNGQAQSSSRLALRCSECTSRRHDHLNMKFRIAYADHVWPQTDLRPQVETPTLNTLISFRRFYAKLRKRL